MADLFFAIILLGMIFVLAFIIVLFFLFISYTFYFEIIRKNAPFVPTRIRKYKKQFELLFDFLAGLNLKDKKILLIWARVTAR